VHQITGDGQVRQVDEQATTPFACVTSYTPISHDDLVEELACPACQDW
jgi:hypothetical protein